VFFYAGHGIAISGTNYLLPVDADIKSEMDVKLGAAINIDLTLDQTMSDAKVKLVFLDACRDNPFAAKIKSNSATRSVSVQSGLAEMKSGEGTLIAFATGPGQTALDGQEGTDSPFTRALIAHITQPGVEIQQAMTEVRAQVNEETNKGQLPWGHTNLIGSVYLNPAPAPAANVASPSSSAPAAVASSNGATDVELEFWRSVKESNKPEELNAYLSSYPNGQFKSLALARIAELQTGPSTATRNLTTGPDPATFTAEATQVTEDQIGLDRGQRRDVQRRLTGLGFDTRASGKFDEATRAVITRWQAARGYPATGFLNKLQHKALLAEIVATTDTSANNDHEDKPARHRRGGGGRRRSPVSRSQRSRRLHRRRGRRVVPVGHSAPERACLHPSRRRTRARLLKDKGWAFRRGVGPSWRGARQRRASRTPRPPVHTRPSHPAGSARRSRRSLPNHLAQRIVDAVLPARTIGLEVLENVLIDSQRNLFLDTGKRGLFGRCFRHLGRGSLERRFSFGAGIVQGSGTSRLIRHG